MAVVIASCSLIAIIPKKKITLSEVVRQSRGLDALVQVVVIFSGVLGLLAEMGLPWLEQLPVKNLLAGKNTYSNSFEKG